MSTNLEDSVLQVQDVDVVVSRTRNQTVVLSQREHGSHDAGSQDRLVKHMTLTLALRTMELISGISRLDLKQDPLSVTSTDGWSQGRCLTCSLVSLSTLV